MNTIHKRANKVFTLLVIVVIGILANLTNQARQEKININKNTPETATNFTCPTGYIRVPGNSLYQTKGFCVMKYEAKTGSATVAATTQAAGTPQLHISQTDAITACSLNGAGYGLINNREWMTIARNIEAQNSNWTGGAVGSGGLWRGYDGNSYDDYLSASTDDDPYFGTNNSGTSIEKRTLTLSNGETIWDLSGNVSEWTNDSILGKDQPTGIRKKFRTREYTAITNYGTLSYDLIRPSNNTWNSKQNMGQIYSDGSSNNTTSYAFLRGGGSIGSDTGVFSLIFWETAYKPMYQIFGFRCVLR